MLFNFLRRKSDRGLWRQGDVFIIPTDAIPKDVLPHRPVLAEGEVTGHAHRLADPKKGQVFRGSNGRLFLEVSTNSATIVHEEHGPVTVPKGSYIVRIQREYHPKEIRRVVD